MSLIVTKKVKDLFKAKGLKTSQEAVDAINQQLEKLCLSAADKVIADKLKTVKAAHIPQLDSVLNRTPDSASDF